VTVWRRAQYARRHTVLYQ